VVSVPVVHVGVVLTTTRIVPVTAPDFVGWFLDPQAARTPVANTSAINRK
jgi:hypothetical protein